MFTKSGVYMYVYVSIYNIYIYIYICIHIYIYTYLLMCRALPPTKKDKQSANRFLAGGIRAYKSMGSDWRKCSEGVVNIMFG